MKNIEDFTKLALSDGQISQLRIFQDKLFLDCLDWKSKVLTLIFNDVIGVEVFNIVGEDLSHGTVSSADSFINRSCAIAKENMEELWCFSIYSIWSEESILRIVARSFDLQYPPEL
jgi:hypothetical protein